VKLSRFGPRARTVLIAAIALALALAISSLAFGRELRVTTAQDLINCATGAPLVSGPDAGIASTDGDTCVLSPGTYDLTGLGTVTVTLRSLTIRSREGAAVTIVQGATPVFSIERDNVTIGGSAPDQGLTIRGSTGAGIVIGGGATPPGEADEDITIQNNFITDNDGDGIEILTPGAVKTFRFEGNDFRGNGGNGIRFDPAVTTVGGSNPEEGVWISGNAFDSNGGDAIHFGNSSGIENLTISRNEILRSGDSGILFANSVTTIESVSIVENVIQQNGFVATNIGAGIAFLNSGDISSLTIADNRGATPDQGITGNWGPGILFDGAGTFTGILPVAGGGVTDLDDIVIRGNVISDNGGGGTPLLLDGIAFFNGGDIGNLKLEENTLRLNAGNGVLLANRGDFEGSEISGNLFRNNGTNGIVPSYGDGFAAVVNGDISRIVFEGNESRENAVRGVFLGSVTGEVSEIRFTGGNQFIKNGLGLAPGLIPGTAGHGLELSSFEDITNIELDGVTANQNGGSGVRLDALGNAFSGYFFPPAAQPPFPGDVLNVTVTGGTFNLNGASAPIGAGNGLAVAGETVRAVTLGQVTADANDDHGVFINSTEDITEVSIENGEFSANDRNHDSIGAGVYLDAAEDMNNVTLRANKASGSQVGFHFTINGDGRAITVEGNPEVNDNSEEGLLFDVSGDLTDVDVLNNVFSGNGTGIRLAVINRGMDITVKGNRIAGTFGIGILLDSTGVTITENDIRGQEIGIKVNKLRDNQIHRNNIVARRGRFGMDATGLGPAEEIDATENWWGEPSGPFHPTKNPLGAGSEVSDKVIFEPWLLEPAVKTGAFFEVLELSISPTSVDVGEEVTITATIKNTGTEEGTQQVKLTITDAAGKVVDQDAKTATVNKDATTEIVFKYRPTEAGTYRAEVAADTSKSGSFTVVGPPALTIEQAVAQHTGDPTIIEDPDIIWAIELWIASTPVPGTDALVIDDDKVLELVELWIAGTPVSAAVSGAAVETESKPKRGFSLFDWLFGFFAGRPTAASASASASAVGLEIDHQASPTQVAPGGSFTVTIQVQVSGGEAGGLLLAAELPAGWTVTPLDNAGAFYKPSEQKWLWLSAPTTTLSYGVHVPEDAPPGIYTIAGTYKTAEGSGAIRPLTIVVLGEPVALKVDAIKFTGSRFIVEGQGIAGIEAQVWDLTGKLIFSGAASGNALSVASLATAAGGAPLANGVYLYAVTVKGAGGGVYKSKVHKLVVVR